MTHNIILPPPPSLVCSRLQDEGGVESSLTDNHSQFVGDPSTEPLIDDHCSPILFTLQIPPSPPHGQLQLQTTCIQRTELGKERKEKKTRIDR